MSIPHPYVIITKSSNKREIKFKELEEVGESDARAFTLSTNNTLNIKDVVRGIDLYSAHLYVDALLFHTTWPRGCQTAHVQECRYFFYY